MKLMAYVKGLRQRRARARYEREKARREEQDEDAMQRAKDLAGHGSGGFNSGA